MIIKSVNTGCQKNYKYRIKNNIGEKFKNLPRMNDIKSK